MKECIPFFRVYREGENLKNFFLPGKGIVVGKGEGVNIAIPSPDIDGRLLYIYFDENKKVWVENINEDESLLLNGKRFKKERILPGNVISRGITFIEFSVIEKEKVVRLLKTKLETHQGKIKSEKSFFLYLSTPDQKKGEIEIPIKIGTFLIGSKNCHILLKSPDVSEKHAAIEVMPDENVYIRDLKSHGGTFLNGIRISVASLKNNDTFTIGRFKFRFFVKEPDRKTEEFPTPRIEAKKTEPLTTAFRRIPMKKKRMQMGSYLRWGLLGILILSMIYYIQNYLRSSEDKIETRDMGRQGRMVAKGGEDRIDAGNGSIYNPEKREANRSQKVLKKSRVRGRRRPVKKKTNFKKEKTATPNLEEELTIEGEDIKPMRVWGGNLPPKYSDENPLVQEEKDPYEEFGIPRGTRIIQLNFDDGADTKVEKKKLRSATAPGEADIDVEEVKEEGGSKKGRIDLDIVFKVIEDNRASMRFCYEKEAKSNPYLEGKIELLFTLGVRGRVEKVVFDEKRSTLKNPNINLCIENMLKGLTFPPPSGGSVTIPYSFTFRSQL